MCGGQVTVVILNKVEKLDQQVAAARPDDQKRTHFLQGIEVDLAAFGGAIWLPATAGSVWSGRLFCLDIHYCFLAIEF
jgi:hypothetical protein